MRAMGTTVHALIYLMRAIHEAIDLGNCSADFTKGFDFIHHSILLDDLRSFNIDQTPFFSDTLLPYQPTIHTSNLREPKFIPKKYNLSSVGHVQRFQCSTSVCK